MKPGDLVIIKEAYREYTVFEAQKFRFPLLVIQLDSDFPSNGSFLTTDGDVLYLNQVFVETVPE
jgi:hypothetical protein